MYYLYEWTNLKENSPDEFTRNDWLWRYGAFACKSGIWFPCKVTRYNTIGAPATVLCIPIATFNQDLYPSGEVLVTDLDVLYSPFSDGRSIFAYAEYTLQRKNVTDRMLNSAIRRSLNTEVVYAPKRLLNHVKKAINRFDKAETFVVDVNSKDEIGAIELPRTIEIVEKLWNSNDWALQEICQLLGMSYNPSQGKKERMLQQEMLGDRDLTIMNRKMLTNRLITASEKFGETVNHISTKIDAIDRGLTYGMEGENSELDDKQ